MRVPVAPVAVVGIEIVLLSEAVNGMLPLVAVPWDSVQGVLEVDSDGLGAGQGYCKARGVSFRLRMFDQMRW